jgi:hypothetical protein
MPPVPEKKENRQMRNLIPNGEKPMDDVFRIVISLFMGKYG